MPEGAATLQKQNYEVHYPCRFSNLFSHEFQMTPPTQSKFWVALAIAPKNHELENAMVWLGLERAFRASKLELCSLSDSLDRRVWATRNKTVKIGLSAIGKITLLPRIKRNGPKVANQRAHGKEGSKFRLKSQVDTGCTRFSQNFQLFHADCIPADNYKLHSGPLEPGSAKWAQNGVISTSDLNANRANAMCPKGAFFSRKLEPCSS